MRYNPRDSYFKKAKAEGFAARSVYKLEEMDQKYRLIKPGQAILDLGASPGSWSQYALKKVGNRGLVIGIDLNPVELSSPRYDFVQGDIREFDLAELLGKHELSYFDLVLSDMAPKTTGIRLADQAASLELCEMAAQVADQHLAQNGHFVCKIFQSAEAEAFRKSLKTHYKRVEILKPKGTRKESKEIFLIGLHRLKSTSPSPS